VGPARLVATATVDGDAEVLIVAETVDAGTAPVDAEVLIVDVGAVLVATEVLAGGVEVEDAEVDDAEVDDAVAVVETGGEVDGVVTPAREALQAESNVNTVNSTAACAAGRRVPT
jgi:hypothetical protein